VRELIERFERRRVELPQRRAQLVRMPGPGPDQVLVGAGGDLDRRQQFAVGRDGAVVVPIGTDQIGQHLGVTAVGLAARCGVAVAVAVHRHRVDRVHLVAGSDQRADQQPAVGLDPDHDLVRLLGMTRDALVEPADTGRTVTDLELLQRGPLGVEDAHLVGVLGPVDPNVDHAHHVPLVACAVWAPAAR
jgi:hypothetical protein